MPAPRPPWLAALLNRRMLICIFTGFASGLPLYLLLNLVPAWLKTEGLSLKAIGAFALMIWVNPALALIAGLIVPFAAWVITRYGGRMTQNWQAQFGRVGAFNARIEEAVGGIRVVKAFGQGAFERARLAAKSRESVEAALFARRVRSLLGPVVTSFVALGTAGVLWFGAQEVLSGAMTAGALVVFLNYLGRLFRPIQSLARASTSIACSTRAWFQTSSTRLSLAIHSWPSSSTTALGRAPPIDVPRSNSSCT